jgi:hypothetical protein
MNTEYAVGNIRIHFESRVRRPWFVALVYVVLAAFDFTVSFLEKTRAIPAWLIAGCGILGVALWIVLTGLAGDMRARGDEREMHRRDHAHFRAYWFIGYGVIAPLFAGYFAGPNPITPLLPLAMRAFLIHLPQMLIVATFILYLTLPQAILLWTEPDLEPES